MTTVYNSLGQFDFDKEVEGLFEARKLENNELDSSDSSSNPEESYESTKDEVASEKFEEVLLSDKDEIKEKDFHKNGNISANTENSTANSTDFVEAKERTFLDVLNHQKRYNRWGSHNLGKRAYASKSYTYEGTHSGKETDSESKYDEKDGENRRDYKSSSYSHGAHESSSYGHESSSYGHESSSYGGHESVGYGGDHGGYGSGGDVYDDHKGGLVGYGNDNSKKIQPKHPGPYGPAKPNFKCEKSKETLFVTKVSFALDEKCFTVFKVECAEGYDTGKVRL